MLYVHPVDAGMLYVHPVDAGMLLCAEWSPFVLSRCAERSPFVLSRCAEWCRLCVGRGSSAQSVAGCAWEEAPLRREVSWVPYTVLGTLGAVYRPG